MTTTDAPLEPRPFASESFNLSLTELAAILAPFVKKPDEELRCAIDKVRKRIGRAVGSGALHVKRSNASYRYSLPEATAWARGKWPGRFLQMTAQHAAVLRSNIVMSDAATSFWYPSDIERSHQQIEQLTRDVRLLVAELDKAQAENDYLRPLAQKYEENREKNRRSASLPRTPQ